jgi:hypothetical protein
MQQGTLEMRVKRVERESAKEKERGRRGGLWGRDAAEHDEDRAAAKKRAHADAGCFVDGRVEPATFFYFASGPPPPDPKRFWIPMIDLLFRMTEAFAACFAAHAYFDK